MIPLFKKSATESVTQVQDNITRLKQLKSVSKIDAICKNEGISILPRSGLPFGYVAFPVDDAVMAVCLIGMELSSYDVTPARSSYILKRSVSLSLHRMLYEFPQTGYWLWSKEDVIPVLESYGTSTSKELAERLKNDTSVDSIYLIKELMNHFYELDIAAMGFPGLEDVEVELSFDVIQKSLLKAMEEYLSKQQALNSAVNANSTSQNTAGPLSVSDAIVLMAKQGGEITVNGKTGYVVEVYYDYNARKLRARTNDGVGHGVMNVRFPNSARIKDAVYVVPKREVGLANSCYSISNNVPLANYRVR